MSGVALVLTSIAVLVAVVALLIALQAIRRLRQREHQLTRLPEEQSRQLHAATDALARAVVRDSVTGLANHRQFQDFLRAEWRRALRDASALSLIMLDLDHFSDYNDRSGTRRPIRACIRSPRRLLGTIQRPSDLVARYGGEEFGGILGHTDRAGALRVATKLEALIGIWPCPTRVRRAAGS